MKILYIMSVYNINGGTPKKTLDLIKNSQNDCYLYMYEKGYEEFKYLFEGAGANITEGHYGKNILKHISCLLKTIDNNNIELIHAQFSFGEMLTGLLKIMRPKVKFIIAFVSPFSPNGLRKIILNYLYKRTDFFIFISEFVKKEKISAFPILGLKKSKIIYNGTEELNDNGDEMVKMKSISLLDIAGLVDWKNAKILIKTMSVVLKKTKSKIIYLYIAGDGPMRAQLIELIKLNRLEKNVFLLGYQSNVGGLLKQCDIFVHPAYAEGFGIAVAEAMMAKKPIIVANAGALPELIENEKSGLIVDPFNAEQWANSIIRLIEDKVFADKLAINAKKKAVVDFSMKKFVNNYELLYNDLLK